MLADACEARPRAEAPKRTMISGACAHVIDTVQKFNQLDNTMLTLRRS